MILVPVKNLVDAKQRLSPVLSPEQRFALAQAMCEDVLQALACWPTRPAVAVVTSDSFARDLAARFNFEVVADDNSGETSAIEPTLPPLRNCPSIWLDKPKPPTPNCPLGGPKLGWFSTLNISARNCNLSDSRIGKSRWSAKSHSVAPN